MVEIYLMTIYHNRVIISTAVLFATYTNVYKQRMRCYKYKSHEYICILNLVLRLTFLDLLKY